MRRSRRSLSLATLLASALASSCGGARSTSPPPNASLALPDGAAEIARTRGHAFRRAVPIEEVSRARMRHVIERQLAEHPTRSDDGAFARAFGFVPPDAQFSSEASVRLNAEQLVGLYVGDDRRIYVRARTRGQTAIAASDILHELEHALQDDVFGMSAIYADVSVDEALARRAVYEGDATAVSWAVEGMRKGRTEHEAIADHRSEAGAWAASLGVSQELDAGAELASASRLVRMELLFPYAAGSQLVVETYLAGGQTLVDGLFRKLPVSTEQVIHPDKYFAGEKPIPVAAPAAPPGYHVVASGTAGELRTRAFLELTLPAERAINASAGWGGDAYTIVARDGDTSLAVLWSTTWDDVTHAERFAAALEEATRCNGPCSRGDVEMRRKGRNVAWTRGLDGAAPLDALLALPGPTPKSAPPHGEVKLAAATEGEELVPVAEDRVQRAERFGLRARVPARFGALRWHGSQLGVVDPSGYGRGYVTYEAKRFDPATFGGTVKQVAAVLSDFPTTPERISDVSLPVGAGKRARWELNDGVGDIVFIAVPYCGDRGTLYLTTVARAEEAAAGLAQWLQSIEPMGPGLPLICGEPSP